MYSEQIQIETFKNLTNRTFYNVKITVPRLNMLLGGGETKGTWYNAGNRFLGPEIAGYTSADPSTPGYAFTNVADAGATPFTYQNIVATGTPLSDPSGPDVAGQTPAVNSPSDNIATWDYGTVAPGGSITSAMHFLEEKSTSGRTAYGFNSIVVGQDGCVPVVAVVPVVPTNPTAPHLPVVSG